MIPMVGLHDTHGRSACMHILILARQTRLYNVISLPDMRTLDRCKPPGPITIPRGYTDYILPSGDTPLTMVIKSGEAAWVEQLCEAGAQVCSVTRSNITGIKQLVQ